MENTTHLLDCMPLPPARITSVTKPPTKSYLTNLPREIRDNIYSQLGLGTKLGHLAKAPGISCRHVISCIPDRIAVRSVEHDFKLTFKKHDTMLFWNTTEDEVDMDAVVALALTCRLLYEESREHVLGDRALVVEVDHFCCNFASYETCFSNGHYCCQLHPHADFLLTKLKMLIFRSHSALKDDAFYHRARVFLGNRLKSDRHADFKFTHIVFVRHSLTEEPYGGRFCQSLAMNLLEFNQLRCVEVVRPDEERRVVGIEDLMKLPFHKAIFRMKTRLNEAFY